MGISNEHDGRHLYDVAISLSGLMAAALVAINRTDDAALTSE